MPFIKNFLISPSDGLILLNTSDRETYLQEKISQINKLLFGTKKLNLRSNLANCNFGYLNYNTICVAALMFSLFEMVSLDKCLI